MKVCLIFDGIDFADIICSNISDAEEMVLTLTEEELYRDFLRYNPGKHNISWQDYMKCWYFDAKIMEIVAKLLKAGCFLIFI